MTIMTTEPKPPARRARSRRELIADRVRMREGAECLLHDGPVWVRARLRELRTDAWGVRITLEVVPAAGMMPVEGAPPHLAASWDFLRAWPTHWTTAWERWTLVFDTLAIEDLTALATRSAVLPPVERARVLEADLTAWLGGWKSDPDPEAGASSR
jgi:hypothetical protein